MQLKKIVAAMAVSGFATGAYATNGMNVECYGPVSCGMGGASFGYDNGTAAMMNNPATLGLAADGHRLDLALGFLGPDVQNTTTGEPSGGDSYLMPAIGWARKSGNLTYGIGMFAQGGMGTEWSGANSYDGLPERSELGVGRLIAPLAFNVNDKLTIGGSVDFVWAMLDLRMAMPIGDGTYGMSSMVTSASGNLKTALGGMMSGAPLTAVRLDASDGSDFTGQAKGYGMAGKLGFTYKASPMVTIGGTYHTKTSLGDIETGATDANFVVAGGVGGTLPGKLTIHDFQWPETYGLGISVQATPALQVVADWKHIGWEDVMRQFSMTYSTAVPGFDGSASFRMPQNWGDQDVFSIGFGYKVNDALTLRAGASFADNPIPSAFMYHLFPAIEENHYMLGVGYAFNKASDINFSVQHAPEVSQAAGLSNGMNVTHSQTSWQLMYSHRF